MQCCGQIVESKAFGKICRRHTPLPDCVIDYDWVRMLQQTRQFHRNLSKPHARTAEDLKGRYIVNLTFPQHNVTRVLISFRACVYTLEATEMILLIYRSNSAVVIEPDQ